MIRTHLRFHRIQHQGTIYKLRLDLSWVVETRSKKKIRTLKKVSVGSVRFVANDSKLPIEQQNQTENKRERECVCVCEFALLLLPLTKSLKQSHKQRETLGGEIHAWKQR